MEFPIGRSGEFENGIKNKVFGIIMLKTLLKIRYSDHDDDDDDDYDGYKNHHF